MKIIIETIPHKDQRYPTCGDYYRDDQGFVHIRVSRLANKRHEMLVIIHELVEALLCEAANISDASIDIFDRAFERNRKPGDTSEPGDDDRAPYYCQHQIATGIERIVAVELGVSWSKYEQAINSLD